jgi:hypothetical protein
LPPISVTAAEAAIEIGPDEVAPFFSVEACGNSGRIHQIAEHHRDVAAFAGNLRRRHDSRGRNRERCQRGSRRRRGCRLAEVRDFTQQLASTTERHPDLFEVLIREIGQDGKADVVLDKPLRVLR